MKQRTPAQKRLIAAAFAGLLLFLALLLWQGIRRGDAVRVGVPKSAQAMGAGMLLQTPSAQYHCTLGSTPEALATALRQGELDAALLPYETARTLEGCRLRAILGDAPLLVLTRQSDPLTLSDLNGSVLTVQADLQGTAAEDMLRRVLREAGVLCQIAFGESGDPYLCDADTAARLLSADEGWRADFSVAQAWRRLLPDAPPPGLCLAVRQAYLDAAGTDYAAFERALQSSLRYSREKRKKTVAMAVAAGLLPDETTADSIYGCLRFDWRGSL